MSMIPVTVLRVLWAIPLGLSLWSLYRFMIRLAERCTADKRSPNEDERVILTFMLGLVVLLTASILK
jgi:hypothetical protein